MKVASHNLAGILTPEVRYIIPLFQRYYSWEEEQWERLWDDMTELRESPLGRNHFMGPLVFLTENDPSKMSSFQVIDGQQRLVTLTLFLCALRNHAVKLRFDELSLEITESYLTHKFKSNSEFFRIYPRQRDREDYIAAIRQRPVINPKSNVSRAVAFFEEMIQKVSNNEDQEVLRDLFNCFCRRTEFVQINLDANENAFQIFKSLNSTGVDLAESDLIRNSVFMRVPEKEYQVFDDEYWRPLEERFASNDPKLQGKPDGREFSAFLRDVLMYQGRYIHNNETYEVFERTYKQESDPKRIVAGLRDHLDLYDVARGNRIAPFNDSKVDDALSALRRFDNLTARPLLLNMLHRAADGKLPASELSYAIKLITSFILRRSVCNQSSRNYSEMFVTACARLDKNPVEDLRSLLIERGFPKDDEFQKAFVSVNLYRGKHVLAILKSLELAIPHKERTNWADAQIEHIMPQNIEKSEHWQTCLGPEYDRIHKELCHTIGNLTLTKRNSELGNKPFIEKRKKYEESGFKLTSQIASRTSWTEHQIRERAKQLAEMAVRIWISPDL